MGRPFITHFCSTFSQVAHYSLRLLSHNTDKLQEALDKVHLSPAACDELVGCIRSASQEEVTAITTALLQVKDGKINKVLQISEGRT